MNLSQANVWAICFFVSLAVLLVSVILAIRAHSRRSRRLRKVNPFHLLIAGLLIAALVCLIPINNCHMGDGGSAPFRSFLFSLHDTFQIFTVDSDTETISKDIKCPLPWLSEGLPPPDSEQYRRIWQNNEQDPE